ncbi:MAG: hypothetical protein NTU97_02075, partial [Candidatus Magasanikbacteria bacterium]|nr:hypothetical protein [Candidatus Magasanikbacteria bacterium]
YNVIPDMVGSTGNVSLYNLGASTTRWSNVWAENVNIGTSTWSLNQGANGRLSFLNGLGGSEIFSIARDGQVVNNGGAYTSGVAQTAASYGTNILTNGSLDAWTGSVPDGWTEINPGGGSGIISQENTIVHTALGSAIKNAAAADGAKVDYQTISGLTPGASYELKLWGYVATGASGAIGSIIIVDGSFGVDANYVWVNATQSWDAIVGGNPSPGILSINTLEDTWEQLAVIVTVPASGKISIILNNTASGVGKLAYFDDVSLRSYTPAAVVTAFNFNTQSTIGASSYLLNVKNNGTSAMSLTGSGLTVAGGISLTGGVSTASNLTFSSSSVNRINFATTTLFYSSNNSASTPTFIFDTANNISNSHVISIRNQGTPIFSIAPNGDVRALGNLYSFSSVVGTPGNPGDLAERVDVLPEEMVEAGDLMMVDYKNNDTYRKTTSSYEGKISGVISTNPTITVGDGKTSSTAVMALSGRVPLKVSEENGPIRKGDYLVSSNQPGVAMKATEPGMVVGMALEDFVTPTSSPIGKILTFVSPRFTIGTINADGTLEILSSENKPQEDGLLDGFSRTIKNSLKKLGIIVYEGITKVKELFADKVTTDRLCVGTTCVDEETLKTLLQKNSVAPTSAPASTPEPTVEPVVEPTPEITPTPESTPAPEVVAPDPNPTPTPEPTPAPEVVTPEPTPAPAN